MTLYPVNVYDVCDAVRTMMTDDPDLEGATVTLGEVINEDVNVCPWLGIYRTGVVYPSRVAGAGSGYRRNNVGLLIMAQESGESGEECAKNLEALIQNVVRVLMNDESLKGNVDVLDGFEVVYERYGLVQDAYMQTALIHFVGIRNVSAR